MIAVIVRNAVMNVVPVEHVIIHVYVVVRMIIAVILIVMRIKMLKVFPIVINHIINGFQKIKSGYYHVILFML